MSSDHVPDTSTLIKLHRIRQRARNVAEERRRRNNLTMEMDRQFREDMGIPGPSALAMELDKIAREAEEHRRREAMNPPRPPRVSLWFKTRYVLVPLLVWPVAAVLLCLALGLAAVVAGELLGIGSLLWVAVLLMTWLAPAVGGLLGIAGLVVAINRFFQSREAIFAARWR